jgi:hypothetical protein
MQWCASRHGAGGAEFSTFWSAGSRRLRYKAQTYTFKTPKPALIVTHFLQQKHTYSNKAIPPDSDTHSLWAKHSHTWIYGHHTSSNHHIRVLLWAWTSHLTQVHLFFKNVFVKHSQGRTLYNAVEMFLIVFYQIPWCFNVFPVKVFLHQNLLIQCFDVKE